jgi:chromosome segregation protein
MYLKRLESAGFKSFAERISVEFVPGVTAVVGPNGSGKSNITDAIRWVLGEQSAKSMRGSKMEDIIFQGSDTRKALNVAEVSLVLDNSDKKLPLDYEEVSVTRRVYRSGESEFYINKQSCRLKDIIDLFMDSGLGKEAFSIISQGKVEEVLSAKAEERRAIFEEAAGVLKYKQRKGKAEYKLAETQENLNRVEDIIHEIEQQISPLGEQAEKAKKYKELKELLKQEEISLLVAEISKLHQEWEALKTELEKDRQQEISEKAAIQISESNVEKERHELEKLDNSIETLQTTLLSLTRELEQLEGKKQVLNEQMKHFSENKEKLLMQKNASYARLEAVGNECSKEKHELEKLKAAQTETKQHLSELADQLAVNQENIAEQIEDLKAAYIEKLNEQAAKRNENQSIQQQWNQMSGKRERQEGKFQDLLTLRKSLTEEKEVMKKQLSGQNRQCENLEKEIQRLKSTLSSERNGFQEAQQQLYQGYQYIGKLKSKKEMLEEMKEDFQGFFHGVKAVLKACKKNQLQNIYGAVIELIDVPEPYITAIETVLGSQAQHIVTKDEQTAREAISWLKKTNSGRATFLPLRSIQPRFITKDILEKVKEHPGFVGVAADLAVTEDSYLQVLRHLMGHVIIAENLHAANEIANIAMKRYRVVTLAGDIVNPGGSMSGGAQKKTNQSLFTRDKDLQETIRKLNNFQEKARAFEKQTEQKKQQIEDAEEELETNENRLNTDRHKLQEMRHTYKELELRADSLNDNLKLYDQDKQQFEEDSIELTARGEKLAAELEEISAALETIQGKIDQLSDQENSIRKNKKQIEDAYHKTRIALAEQDVKVKSQQEKTKALEQQLSDLQAEHETHESELNKLSALEDITESEPEIDRLIQMKKTEKETVINQIQQSRSDRARRTKLVQDQDRELKEAHRSHQKMLTVLQEKEVQTNRLDVQLENRLHHLQTEYMITYERACQLYEKSAEIEKTREKVSRIKQQLEQLGTVNLGAIDEYDRISERHTFLTGQRDDLVQAKETMYAVIAEMDEEMQKRFEETFTQIKTEFTAVFRELFGGGRAELKLTDPEHLLDTGIDITAQPPGKKLKHLGLLSGGERALTAIALLFAILRVRSVPFCILDEVEAALDEANVVRFAKYVKAYSEKNQFIVITHRKGTMEEADVLYGVTMQESGVSRFVSVRLEDTEELVQSSSAN